ncbi:hypothetical protein RUND412_000739 [Rhizina undulata]
MPGSSSLLSLPEEVLEQVLTYVPDEDTILTINRVCRTLQRLVNQPLEWRNRCKRFHFWEPKHNYAEKRRHPRPAEIDWKVLFVHRFHVERRTTKLLNEIIASPMDRIRRFNEIADFGYDAMDCLAGHAKAGEEIEDVLARRWQASVAIHYIHRRRAIHIWKRLAAGDPISLEVALGCFDLFVLNTASDDIEDTAVLLDEIAERFKSQTPNLESMTTKDKALLLSTFLHSEGYRGATTEQYRALKNSFIGVSIRTDKATLPLTSVVLYCALATRIGVKAQPCGFPYHVIAIVHDDETKNYIYLDPFRGDGKELERPALEEKLRTWGMYERANYYLSPSLTGDIVMRTSRNILESIRQTDATSDPVAPIDRNAALYASLVASVLSSPRISVALVKNMTRLIQNDFPMDVRFFEEDLVPGLEDPNGRQLLENVCGALRAEDSSPRTVTRRATQEEMAVKYRIGTIFRHKRYSYQGVIFGWTKTCNPAEGETWIQEMRLDESLHRGRNQPFYHVLVTDKTCRYIAEENICEMHPERADELSQMAGKWFKRFCKKSRSFVSNIRDEFPDD